MLLGGKRESYLCVVPPPLRRDVYLDVGHLNVGVDDWMNFVKRGCQMTSASNDEAVEEGNHLEGAQQEDEEKQVDDVGDQDRGNVVRQLLQKLSEGLTVRLRSNPVMLCRVKNLSEPSNMLFLAPHTQP